MNSDNIKKLKTEFKLFKLLPEKEFCIEDGWFDIIYEMFKKLDELCKVIPEEKYPYVMCLKQKFGGLRCYLDDYNKELDKELMTKLYDIVMEYEVKSYKLCETCGQPGKLMISSHNWIYMACEKHTKENSTEYKGVL